MLPSERTPAAQPHPPKHDLDSTDELPVLDVVAYEAGLAGTQQGLSRTDTWTVEALQDIDDIVESVQIASAAGDHAGLEKTPDSSTLTVNVNRILKRISDLESDIVAAHEANAVLRKRAEAIQAERDEHAARIRALEAENARISEHRALSAEMARRLEHQLEQLHATHTAERTHIDQEQAEAERKLAQMAAEHERRIAHMTAERATLQQEHRAMQEQLRAAREAADQQTQALAAATKALGNEQASSAQLARRLAVKLTEYDKLQSTIELRSRTLDELTDDRDELRRRLEAEVAARSEIEERLSVAAQSLAGKHELLVARENALARKEQEVAKLAAETAELRNAVETAERKAAANQDGLSSAAAVRGEMERIREQLEAKLAGLEQALRTRDELAENLRGNLQAALDQQAIVAGHLDEARARVKSLSQEIVRRDHKIAELQADLAVHTEALAAIRQDVNRIGDNVEAASSSQAERMLEPIEHNGPPILLTGKMMTVGRTSENDVCLPSKLVSRHHARLLVGPTGVIVEDAGSTNGCYVNGEQVRHHLMRDGDVLELGDMRYRLRTRPVHDTAIHPKVVQLFDDPEDELRTR